MLWRQATHTHTHTACLQSSTWLINLLVRVVRIRGIKVAGSLQTHPAILPWGSGAVVSHPLMRGRDTHTSTHSLTPQDQLEKSLTCPTPLLLLPPPPAMPSPFLSQTPQIPVATGWSSTLVVSHLPNKTKSRGGMWWSVARERWSKWDVLQHHSKNNLSDKPILSDLSTYTRGLCS